MCRMIGFSFNKVKNVKALFNSLKKMSKNGIKSPHSHGWGIAIKHSMDEIIFHKSIQPIYNEKEVSLKGKIGIMHSRKASPNLKKTFLQLHPYLINETFFCHNGTIYFNNINNFFGTDSFEFFRFIESFSTEEELIRKINEFSNKYDYTAINFLLIKEDKLYSYCDFKKEENYYRMWYSEKDGVIISSEKLDNSFFPFKNKMLLIASNGKICNIKIVRPFKV